MRNQCAPSFPVGVITRAGRLNVPPSPDGLKATKIEIPGGGCVAMEITPVEHGMKAIGTATTVETDNGDNFPIHAASYSVKKDGYVMMIDREGHTGRVYFGGLITEARQATGSKGMVIDGYARDRGGSVEFRFPAYGRGLMPRRPIKKDEGSINTPTMCSNMKMGSDDSVVGDSDGVCVIPREHIETVLSKTGKKLAYEENREKTIVTYRKARAEGRGPPQLTSQWVLDMLQAG